MKTIVMTGGTSGLGAVAARLLAGSPDVHLLVGSRGIQPPKPAEAVPLDLSSLGGTRRFATEVLARLGRREIDGLALNAGLSLSDADQRSEDGFETTFAVNHLAHYLMLRLLGPHLAAGATVVLTTSDLHDPAINKMAPPRHAEANRLAHPEPAIGRPERRFVQGLRAYAASKVCNILTAHAFAALSESRARDLRVIAYNPGFTPGTRLVRGGPLPMRVAMATLAPVLRPLLRINTVSRRAASWPAWSMETSRHRRGEAMPRWCGEI